MLKVAIQSSSRKFLPTNNTHLITKAFHRLLRLNLNLFKLIQVTAGKIVEVSTSYTVKLSLRKKICCQDHILWLAIL